MTVFNPASWLRVACLHAEWEIQRVGDGVERVHLRLRDHRFERPRKTGTRSLHTGRPRRPDGWAILSCVRARGARMLRSGRTSKRRQPAKLGRCGSARVGECCPCCWCCAPSTRPLITNVSAMSTLKTVGAPVLHRDGPSLASISLQNHYSRAASLDAHPRHHHNNA